MKNVKRAFARFSFAAKISPVFAALLIFGCGGDMDELLCMTCGNYRMSYCLYNSGGGSYSCEYINVGKCNGTNYGTDNTCGGYGQAYTPAGSSDSSGDNSAGSGDNNSAGSGDNYDGCKYDMWDHVTQFCGNDDKVHEKCNGKIYDTATQFCQEGTDEVKPLCNGVEYTSDQKCEDNVVKDKCGNGWFNPLNQICDGDVVKEPCGSDYYNPATHFCQEGADEDKVKPLCGGETYASTQVCDGDVVKDICNGSMYNPKTHFCTRSVNNPQIVPLCNGKGYDTKTKFCQGGTNVENLCGGETFTSNQFCGSDDKPHDKCNGQIYDTATQFCQEGTNGTDEVKPFCGGVTYTSTEFCQADTDVVKPLCGTATYTSKEFCQSPPGVVKPLCNGATYNSTQVCTNNVVTIITETGTFIDTRDNKTYKWVKIGDMTWMAENLNYSDSSSLCYSCSKYGRLYDYWPALSACPGGWRLPSNAEWEALMTAVGGKETAGTKLKATSGWNNKTNGSSGNGTDAVGFTALPGGYADKSTEKYGIEYFASGNTGTWWSSTPNGSQAYHMVMFMNNDFASLNSNKKTNFWISVRCVKN